MMKQFRYSDGTPIIINNELTFEEINTYNEVLQDANNHNLHGNYDKANRLATGVYASLTHTNETEIDKIIKRRGEEYVNSVLEALSFTYHVLGTNARYQEKYSASQEHLEKSYQISCISGSISSQARALGNLGLLMGDQYRVEEEFDFYRKAIDLDSSVNNKKGMATWLNNIALLHGKLGEYSKALDLFTQALGYDIETDDERGKASRLMNIAIVHMYMENLDISLEYLKASLLIEEKINNVRAIAKVYNNIAAVKSSQKKHEEAAQYLLQSLAIDEQLQNKKGMATVFGNLGDMYIFLGEYDTALEYLLRALALETEMENKRGIGLRMVSIGACYHRRNMFDDDQETAEEYLLKGTHISEEVGNKQHLISCYEQLAKLYEFQNKLAESIKYYKLYFEVEKEVRNIEAQKKGNQIELIIKNSEKEKELAIEKARAEEKEFMIDELTRANLSLSQTIERVELLNEQLHKANEAKNDIIGVVAHDLKNPLTSIMLNVETIKKFGSKLSESESEKILSGVVGAAKRMNAIITGLLDVNALESGRINIIPQPISIVESVKTVLKEYVSKASEKGIVLITNLPENIPPVYADIVSVEQIIDNLVSNAIKYSPLNSKVNIEVIKGINSVKLYVRDEGQGIKQSERDKLFGKFQKLSAKPTAGEHSTGLGLSVAKMLTEQMSGTLWCESVEGEGATFILELPMYSKGANT